jgi:hypothetical protein
MECEAKAFQGNSTKNRSKDAKALGEKYGLTFAANETVLNLILTP